MVLAGGWWWGEAGVGEDLGGGEAGDGGVGGGVGDFVEALEGVLGVVLGGELELLGEEGGAELAVGVVFLRGEDLFGFFLGEVEVGEDFVELGGGMADGGGEVVEGAGGTGGRGLSAGD